MKKILIVNKSFSLGGIQSSMINMANELSKYYSVDLFIYNPTGVLKERLLNRVTVLEPSWRFKALGMSLTEAIRSKDLRIALFRLFATVWSRLFDNSLPIEIAIKHQRTLGKYDMAIAYHHEKKRNTPLSGFTRFVNKCVDANKKIAWLHYDTGLIDLDSDFNEKFYDKMDNVVCVSKSLMDRFAKDHPNLKRKMDYCYNFINYDELNQKSRLEPEFQFPNDKFVCFSACRLTEEKALVRAIESLADIFKLHLDLIWYIAGDGPEKEKINETIKKWGLEEQIVLLGMQKNPYPYMCNADLTLNVSYHEAAPMIFLESKALGTPIFATRTSSAEELLNDGYDAFICVNSEIGIHDKFLELVNNRDLVRQTEINLNHYIGNNSESFSKIDSWMS